MSRAALSFRSIVKDYGRVRALDGLTLDIPPGRLVCLAGGNGAGKTTALDLLMGLRRPTSGEMQVLGVQTTSTKIHRVRRRVGYMAEDPALYGPLTPVEYLEFIGQLYRVGRDARDRAEALLHDLGLDRHSRRRIDQLSMGNRRKTAFAAALLPDPEILILDEPTNGMDVAAARAAKDQLRARRDQGVAVLFTTHVVELAESLADEVAVLHEGRLAAYGTPADLRARSQEGEPNTLEEVLLGIAEDGGSEDRRRG